MTEKLSERTCEPCEGGVDPLEGDALRAMLEKVDDDWEVVDGHHLHRQFDLEDFQEALDFTNRVGEIAEQEDHHPVIHLTWGEVKLDIWTHAIGGLSENDFILAAKVDELYEEL